MMTYIKQEVPNWKNAIIVSPDAGGAKRYVAVPALISPAVVIQAMERSVAILISLVVLWRLPTSSTSSSL